MAMQRVLEAAHLFGFIIRAMLRYLRNTRGACGKAESARNLGRTAMQSRVHAGVAKAAFGAGGAWSLGKDSPCLCYVIGGSVTLSCISGMQKLA